MPKVHPAIEDRQRHYLPGDKDGENLSRLKIHRTLRQRFRVLGNGNQYVACVADFPHAHKHSFLNHLSLEEREEFEAAAWRRGVDIIKLEEARRRFKGSQRRPIWR